LTTINYFLSLSVRKETSMETHVVLLILGIVFLTLVILILLAYMAFKPGGWLRSPQKEKKKHYVHHAPVTSPSHSPSTSPNVGAAISPGEMTPHPVISNPVTPYPVTPYPVISNPCNTMVDPPATFSASYPGPITHQEISYGATPFFPRAPDQFHIPHSMGVNPQGGLNPRGLNPLNSIYGTSHSSQYITKPLAPVPTSGSWSSSWMAGNSNIHNACLINGWDFNQYRSIRYAIMYKTPTEQSPMSDYTPNLYNPPYCNPSMSFVGIPDNAVVDVYRMVTKPDGSLRGPQLVGTQLHPRSSFIDQVPIPS